MIYGFPRGQRRTPGGPEGRILKTNHFRRLCILVTTRGIRQLDIQHSQTYA